MMGFELLQPFLEFLFADIGLVFAVVGGIGLLTVLLLVPLWAIDKAEDFADRLESSWNVKA